MIGAALDKLVGLFSPRSELDRMAARELVAKVRNQYAAAKTTLSTGNWSPVDAKINTVLQNSTSVLRARARQLVRDMPAMATAIDRVEEFIVGNGITMQARVKDPATGKLNKAINQKIEDAWNWWSDEADDGGRLHFHEIQQLCARQEIEAGEYLIVKKRSKAASRFLPLSLMLLEGDSLTTYTNATPAAGNEIHQGVEYDPRTGRALAYHFDDPDRWSKTLRVPSDQIIHGYKTLRPGQLRGVSQLAPVILMSHQLRDYLEANIATAQKASRWLAFVTSNDPAASMAAFGAAASPTYTDSAGNSKYTMEFGHSIIDFLHTGEKVDIANHNLPGDSFGPFVKFMLQTFAATIGVTYELVSGNYYDAKYTAARVSRNDMMQAIGVRRGRLVRRLCEDVRREFLFWAVVTGKLDLPGFLANQEFYNRAVWLEPGAMPLDPQREGRADSDAVAAKLRSPQEILLARGRDPEQVLDEIAEWQDMAKERGIELIEKQSPIKGNPAAVEEQATLDGAKAVRRIK